MVVGFDGTPIATGGGRPDEIVTAEVRPDVVREARRVWASCGFAPPTRYYADPATGSVPLPRVVNG
jgi:predicted O-methyltransferase YrrM